VSLKNRIKDDIIDWSVNVLEKPNKHLNNFPACPYAKQTRLQNKLHIQVNTKTASFFQTVEKEIKRFSSLKKDIIIVADPNVEDVTPYCLQYFVDTRNIQLQHDDIYLMCFHPSSPATMEDQAFLADHEWDSNTVEPYMMVFIQELKKLQDASTHLQKQGYYDEWPKDYYNEVVGPRQKLKPKFRSSL
jgi:hypothetical protein